MKRIIYYITISALALLASCSKEPQADRVGSRGEQPLSISIGFRTKSSDSAPVLGSLRLIAYDGNGLCSMNTLFDADYLASPSNVSVTEVSDGYQITLLNTVSLGLSSSTRYDVFAILNEGSYLLAGTGTTISSLLSALTVGSRSQLQFNSYFNGTVAYSPMSASDGTPENFIMGASQSVVVEPGASDEGSACEVSFTAASTLRRPMAQVTVTGIESAETSVEAASVIIQYVAIENIPEGIAWGSARGTLGKNPVTIALGEANSDGYYTRTTDGTSFVADYTDLTRTRSTDARLYFTGDKALGFVDESSAKFYDKIDNVTNAGNDMDENGYKTLIGTTLPSGFTSATPVLDYDLDSELTPGAWTLQLGASYFVPENISATADKATCIHVRAAIASAGLSDDELNAQASWENPVYYTGSEPFSSSWIKTDNATKTWLKNNHSYIEYTYKNNKGEDKTAYLAYFDGLSCVDTAASDIHVSGSGTTIVWNASEKVYDFYIPVNNAAFDSDYSVRRNTRYTVTLKVNGDTYDTIDTKASAAGSLPFGICAEVKSEKLCGYED